ILIRISTYARRGRRFDYNSHERLKEAIEKKLFADMKDVIRVHLGRQSRSRPAEAAQRRHRAPGGRTRLLRNLRQRTAALRRQPAQPLKGGGRRRGAMTRRPGLGGARDDWSLHRKRYIDQERHREKVLEAIRENLADLVAEESIIMSAGGTVINVPVRSLEEYRFRFDPGEAA